MGQITLTGWGLARPCCALSGLLALILHFPGRCPGLYHFAPLGLLTPKQQGNQGEEDIQQVGLDVPPLEHTEQ